MSERGIEANPEKITDISNMGPVRNVKGVQRLTDYLATLSRFISLFGTDEDWADIRDALRLSRAY